MRALAWLRARPGLVFALLLAGLCLLWAPDAALGKAAFWAHDLRHHHLPWRAWSALRWARGELPLWSPEVGLGFPLMADGQTGVLYPPTQLLFLLLPDPLALNLSLLGHVFWAGLGARALARALGRSEAASALAGLAFAFSGFLATHALYLGFQNAAAWLPWALLGLRRGRLGWTALCVAMMLVAGHPQAAAIGLLLMGASAVIERRKLIFAGAAALGGLVAAPQLAATWELVRYGLRDGGLPEGMAGVGSLPVLELLGGVLPCFFGYERPVDIPLTYTHRAGLYWGQGESFWEMAFYLGVPVVVLALLGLRGQLRLAGPALVALLLMLGDHTPLWPLLRHLPGLGGFRFPARFGLALTLLVALLAAAGLDRALAASREGARRAGMALLAVAVALVVGMAAAHVAVGAVSPALQARLEQAALRPPPPPPPLSELQAAAMPAEEARSPEQAAERAREVLSGLDASTAPAGEGTLWPAALLGAMGLLAMAASRGLPRGPLAVGALALVVVDLFWFGQGFQATFPMAQVNGVPATLAPILAEGGEGRTTTLDRRQDPALDADLLTASLGLLWGTRDVIVPSPLRIVRQEALLSKVGLDVATSGDEAVGRLLAHQPLVELLGVRWLLTVHTLNDPRWTPILQEGAVHLYRDEAAMPRAFLVACARWLGQDAPQAAWEGLDSLDPRAEALVEGEPSGGLYACSEAADPGEARVMEDDGERLRVAVTATTPALLVLADSWYPGWEARVDGQAEPVRRADFVLRGVPVPAGEHEVDFSYRPSWLRAALLATGSGVLGVLAALLWEHRPWRRRRLRGP